MKNNSKKIISIVIIIFFGVFIYYNKKTQTSNPPSPAPIVTENSITGCYVAKLSKDIYTLDIQYQSNKIVTGLVSFKNYEKDSSSGTFNGTISENVLLGNYAFSSEGMNSNRQLIFKKVGDNFIEGFGETKTIGNSETLLDPNNAIYDPNSTFVKSKDCQKQ